MHSRLLSFGKTEQELTAKIFAELEYGEWNFADDLNYFSHRIGEGEVTFYHPTGLFPVLISGTNSNWVSFECPVRVESLCMELGL